MLLLIVGAVFCVCVGVCIAYVVLKGLQKPGAQEAQAIPTEALAHAIPMEMASVQMVPVDIPSDPTRMPKRVSTPLSL